MSSKPSTQPLTRGGGLIGNEIYNPLTGDLVSKTKLYYDTVGFPEKMIKTGPDNRLIEKQKYSNNSQGNFTQADVYNSEGQLVNRFKAKYNTKGARIVLDQYTGNGDLQKKTKNKYDSESNPTQISTYNGLGDLVYEINMKYNEEGHMVKKETFEINTHPAGKKTTRRLKYDSEGNIKEERIQGEKTTYKYVYDDFGNWIKKMTTGPGGHKRYQKRLIKYYNGTVSGNGDGELEPMGMVQASGGTASGNGNGELGPMGLVRASKKMAEGGSPRLELYNDDGFEDFEEVPMTLPRAKELMSNYLTGGNRGIVSSRAGYNNTYSFLVKHKLYDDDYYCIITTTMQKADFPEGAIINNYCGTRVEVVEIWEEAYYNPGC